MVMVFINIFMAKNIEVISKMDLEKVKGNYNIKVKMFMKEIFRKILLMDLVKWFTKMEISTKENGRIVKNMEQEGIHLEMGVFIRDNGEMT